MEDLGGKQEKTAGWELVRLLRFGEDDDGGDDDDDDDDAGDKDCVLVIIMVDGDFYDFYYNHFPSGRPRSRVSHRRMYRW